VAVVEPVIPLLLEVDAGRDALLDNAERHRAYGREAGAVGPTVQIDVGWHGGVGQITLQAEQGHRSLASRREFMAQRRSTRRLPRILAGPLRDVEGGRRVGVLRQFSRSQGA